MKARELIVGLISTDATRMATSALRADASGRVPVLATGGRAGPASKQWRCALSCLVAGLVWVVVFAGAVGAELPAIGAEELVTAVRQGDGPYRNYRASFQIDEYFVPGFEQMFPLPDSRQFQITHAVMGQFYRYEVSKQTDDPVQFPSSRYVDAWNGVKRTQLNPDSGHGDIFEQPFYHAFPIPADFGLTLGNRQTLLGEGLGQCEIVTIRSERIADHECYYVLAQKDNGQKFELWLDPAINWRARKLITHRSVGGLSFITEAEWSQSSDGEWFPTVGSATLYGNDPQDATQRAVSVLRELTVHEVQFGGQDASDFEIVFPIGTMVYDHAADVPYVMGGDGQLELARQDNIIALAPSSRSDAKKLCATKCSGWASCSSQQCTDCLAYTGGSYQTCESAESGTCTPKSVSCGTINWCNEGQGGCHLGLSDCSCNTVVRMVTGC